MPDREKRPTDEQQKANALSRWENEGGAKAKQIKRPHGPSAGPRSATGEEITTSAQQGRATLMNDSPTAI
jgi:hypothetical protein